MKKNLLYIGVLLLTLYSCKKDADLSEIIPYQFTPTTVDFLMKPAFPSLAGKQMKPT